MLASGKSGIYALAPFAIDVHLDPSRFSWIAAKYSIDHDRDVCICHPEPAGPISIAVPHDLAVLYFGTHVSCSFSRKEPGRVSVQEADCPVRSARLLLLVVKY